MTAKYRYPQLASALTELQKHAVAMWYSDSDRDHGSTAYKLIASCRSKATRLVAVMYGLPNKNCLVSRGNLTSTVETSVDYEAFLADFTRIIGSRKIVYVLEPGAVSLLASQDPSSDGCAYQSAYLENLQIAIRLLSVNANAEIYVDVGHSTLGSAESSARVAEIVKKLVVAGRVKGIALDTADYRPTAELSQLCAKFQEAMGSLTYHCVVDTSRNFVSSALANSTMATSSEQCNLRSAGIGQPPTCTTGISNLDYFLWFKPPGESDGACTNDNGTSFSEDSILGGPQAGVFFDQGFVSLWNQGYFVNQLSAPKLASITPATASPIVVAVPLPPPVVVSPLVSTVVNVCATPAWSSCGDSHGSQCCPSGSYCQPWNRGFYQCMQVPAKCSQQFTNMDFVGADLFKLTGISPTDCCVRCAETFGCRGYTFVNESGASCYLKRCERS